MPALEPWLRGQPRLLDPLRSQLMLSLQQAEEDIVLFTDGLSDSDLWVKPFGLASAGYHCRHIIGSIDRLLTYTVGESLSAEQLALGAAEMQKSGSRDELLSDLNLAFATAGLSIRAILPSSYEEERYVGRKKLPTTVGNLLVHIAEHTQRHVGQLIVTSKLVRSRSSVSADESKR